MSVSVHRPVLWIGGVYIAVLLAVAFWPSPVDAPVHRLLERALAWAARRGADGLTYELVESLANVALFVPLGALAGLTLRFRFAWVGLVIGLMTSVLIETGQWLFLDARVATAHDVLMNGAGVLIGLALGALGRAFLRLRERGRRRETDLALATIPLSGASRVDGAETAQRPSPR